jgi:hypothetical protein
MALPVMAFPVGSGRRAMPARTADAGWHGRAAREADFRIAERSVGHRMIFAEPCVEGSSRLTVAAW